ncbi:hypothetical protein HRbin01_01913 [archaeon HR01]|nr:hypothetical protein HRbin01_01913 [archaeon HR01]
MSISTAATVDENSYLALLENTHGAGCLQVIYLINPLYLEEVVSATEGAYLRLAPGLRLPRDHLRVWVGDVARLVAGIPPLLLHPPKVLIPPQTILLDDVSGPFQGHPVQVRMCYHEILPPRAESGWHVAEDGVHQLHNLRPHLFIGKAGNHQPHAAVGHYESIGDEVMAFMVYRKVIHLLICFYLLYFLNPIPYYVALHVLLHPFIKFWKASWDSRACFPTFVE